MKIVIAIFILVVLYLIYKITQIEKQKKMREHAHCCEECRIKELCDDYKNKKHLD